MARPRLWSLHRAVEWPGSQPVAHAGSRPCHVTPQLSYAADPTVPWPLPSRRCFAPGCSSLNLAVSTFNEGFFFNKTLLNMATFIKRKMGWPFYGAHLRLENDASVWNGPDGEERVLNEYINVMGQANFSDTTTVYVASGLLFDGPSPGGEPTAAPQGPASGVWSARGAHWGGARRHACTGSCKVVAQCELLLAPFWCCVSAVPAC